MPYIIDHKINKFLYTTLHIPLLFTDFLINYRYNSVFKTYKNSFQLNKDIPHDMQTAIWK